LAWLAGAGIPLRVAAELCTSAEAGERREGRERGREVKLCLTGIFSKISIETQKSLNMKFVQNSKSYNFSFRHFSV